MKISENLKNSNGSGHLKDVKSSKGTKEKKHLRLEKEKVSSAEIKDRVEKHQEMKSAQKNKESKNFGRTYNHLGHSSHKEIKNEMVSKETAAKENSSHMEEVESSFEKPEKLAVSSEDIDTTKQRIKSLLESGKGPFSGEQRSVLSNIINSHK